MSNCVTLVLDNHTSWTLLRHLQILISFMYISKIILKK